MAQSAARAPIRTSFFIDTSRGSTGFQSAATLKRGPEAGRSLRRCSLTSAPEPLASGILEGRWLRGLQASRIAKVPPSNHAVVILSSSPLGMETSAARAENKNQNTRAKPDLTFRSGCKLLGWGQVNLLGQ